MATDFRDINFTPDFPRTAEIAREMIERELGVTGRRRAVGRSGRPAVPAQGDRPAQGRPTKRRSPPTNAVDILLNQVYARYQEPTGAGRILRRLREADLHRGRQWKGRRPDDSLQQLVKASGEHRILLWSADPDEQAVACRRRGLRACSGAPRRPRPADRRLHERLDGVEDAVLPRRSSRPPERSAAAPTVRRPSGSRTTFRSTAPADASDSAEIHHRHRETAHPRAPCCSTPGSSGPAGGRFTSVHGERRAPADPPAGCSRTAPSTSGRTGWSRVRSIRIEAPPSTTPARRHGGRRARTSLRGRSPPRTRSRSPARAVLKVAGYSRLATTTGPPSVAEVQLVVDDGHQSAVVRVDRLGALAGDAAALASTCVPHLGTSSPARRILR